MTDETTFQCDCCGRDADVRDRLTDDRTGVVYCLDCIGGL